MSLKAVMAVFPLNTIFLDTLYYIFLGNSAWIPVCETEMFAVKMKMVRK